MSYDPLEANSFLRKICDSTQEPTKSVGILVKFLDQDDDFCTTVTTASKNSSTFRKSQVELQLDSTLTSDSDSITDHARR